MLVQKTGSLTTVPVSILIFNDFKRSSKVEKTPFNAANVKHGQLWILISIKRHCPTGMFTHHIFSDRPMNSLQTNAQTPPICPSPSRMDESKWMWSEVCLSDMNKRSPPRCHLLHHHSRGLPYLGQFCSRTCPPLGKTERMWGNPLLCYAGALTVFIWNPLRQTQLTEEHWRVGHVK